MTFRQWLEWRVKGESPSQVLQDTLCGMMAVILEQCQGDAKAATGVFRLQGAPEKIMAMLEDCPDLWRLAKEHFERRQGQFLQQYDEWRKEGGQA